jgi:hypothetical protein
VARSIRSTLARVPRAGWLVFGGLALLGAGVFTYEEVEGDDSDDDDTPDAPATSDASGGSVAAMTPSLPGGTGGTGVNPATRTVVSISDMHNALSNAWSSVVGSEPTDMAVLTLLAQWGLETGNGASMYNYNIGNFKSAGQNGSPPGAYFPLPTTENVGGVTQHMTANFASYDSLDHGVQAYLSAMHGRFGQAWPDVLSGDCDAFAQHLYDQHYYTGIPPNPVATYAAGLKARRALMAGTLGIDLGASPDQSDTDDVS